MENVDPMHIDSYIPCSFLDSQNVNVNIVYAAFAAGLKYMI